MDKYILHAFRLGLLKKEKLGLATMRTSLAQVNTVAFTFANKFNKCDNPLTYMNAKILAEN